MTGPVEMQVNFIRGPEAAQLVSHLANAQEEAQQVNARQQMQKATETTKVTQALKKTEGKQVKSSLEKESSEGGTAFFSKKNKNDDDRDKLVEDEYRGHFLDIRL